VYSEVLREKPVPVPLCKSTKNPTGIVMGSSLNILGDRTVTNQQQDMHIYVQMDVPQESTYSGCQANQVIKLHTVSPNICRSSMKLVSCNFSEAYNFQMSPRFLENLWTCTVPSHAINFNKMKIKPQ